jgi:hypothetical protein
MTDAGPKSHPPNHQTIPPYLQTFGFSSTTIHSSPPKHGRLPPECFIASTDADSSSHHHPPQRRPIPLHVSNTRTETQLSHTPHPPPPLLAGSMHRVEIIIARRFSAADIALDCAWHLSSFRSRCRVGVLLVLAAMHNAANVACVCQALGWRSSPSSGTSVGRAAQFKSRLRCKRSRSSSNHFPGAIRL